MKVYNVIQILVCAYMSIGITLHMYMKMPIFQTFQLFGQNFTFFNMFGINTNYNAGLEWFVFVHYLSKYLDFFDTLFIILRKKDAQHSFLHVFHHATIGSVWGFLLYLGHGNGTAAYGAFINSIVHVVMYTHYLVTSYVSVLTINMYIYIRMCIYTLQYLMHLIFTGNPAPVQEIHYSIPNCAVFFL